MGQRILLDLLKEKDVISTGSIWTVACRIYDQENQDTHAGGVAAMCGNGFCIFIFYLGSRAVSGNGFWFVPTGALLFKVSFMKGQSVPGSRMVFELEHVEFKGGGQRMDYINAFWVGGLICGPGTDLAGSYEADARPCHGTACASGRFWAR